MELFMRVKNITSSLVLLAVLSNSSFANVVANAHKSVKIELDAPLSEEDKSELYNSGVENIVYAGDMSYYIYGEDSSIEKIVSNYKKILSVKRALKDERLNSDIDISSQNLSDLSIDAPINLNVLFLKQMSKSEIEEYLESNGISSTVSNVTLGLKSAKIRVDASDLDRLKELPLIQYIDKTSSIGVRNLKTTRFEKVDQVWSGAYNLTGRGMSVAVVDGGLVRGDHQEFLNHGESRVYGMGNADYADHATHVAGTIGASGYKNDARGMASDVNIYSYSFLDRSFADIVVKIYDNDDVLFSNHSYGYNDKTKLGTYDSEAVKQDRAVSQNPFLNIFMAAGNDGEDPSYPDYGKIKGPANSKNIITVGALNLNASGVARFSSNGPVKDGRIKPDLCTRGEGIYSTGAASTSDYLWMNGTSMASPSATGMGILVAEAYKRVSGGYDIRHDILKSALINAAIDKGRVGPDYDAGFGMIDVKGAVDIVNSLESTSPLLHIDRVSYKESKRFPFQMRSSGEFKATLSWVDPAGNPSSGSSLVNDLDMVLVSESGKKYYPFTLNPANPTALAKSDRENHVDNVEQIRVANLSKGNYTLIVKGSVIVTQSQEFSIASNISIDKNSNINKLEPSKLKNFAKVIQASIL
jgi:hypothetical protein